VNILIIKTGLTETFTPFNPAEKVISLGDVLRTTVILHLFKGDCVTWLTSQEAVPLIQNNLETIKVISQIGEVDNLNFDLIINLERSDDLIKKINMIPHKQFWGFVDAYKIQTINGLSDLTSWLTSDLVRNCNWSEKLFLLLGHTWEGQNYILSRPSINHDVNAIKIGLNWKVGFKWPSKNWSFDHWTFLSKKLDGHLFYSWQEGFDNLEEYISWINSCSTIVTHDSLGLHLAIALEKKVVALFGPTSVKEIHLGSKGMAINREQDPAFACMPCYKEKCDQDLHCMSKIEVEEVFRAIKFLE
jgi:heptosyltransferase-2